MDIFDRGTKKISVSPSILFWTLAIVIFAWTLYQIIEIILLLFLAIILSAALEPSIKKLMSWKFPRGVAIAVIYVAVFIFLFGLLSFLIPSLISETSQVLTRIPETLGQWGFSQSSVQNISDDITSVFDGNGTSEGGGSVLLQRIFSTTLGVVRTGISLLAVVAMSLYILAVDGGVEKFFRAVTPSRYREYVVSRSMEAYRKTGRWLAGQVFLMGIVFILYFVVLSVLGIPGAFALAVWGGLFEIVPYIGPTMAAIPAILLGAFVSPVVGLLVLVSYILIQKLENYWLVPKVMEKALGLHPLVIILVLLAGGKLAGFMGLLLSVPFATVASVFLKDVFDSGKSNEVSSEKNEI